MIIKSSLCKEEIQFALLSAEVNAFLSLLSAPSSISQTYGLLRVSDAHLLYCLQQKGTKYITDAQVP